MEIIDNYSTVKGISEGIYKEKGSKFIARAVAVDTENEVKEILDQVRKEHHGARHHCYAYKIGVGEAMSRANDDGEPAGTAGKPILNQIFSSGLTNVMVVVTRYFGGKKLGASGLIAAYKTAASDALNNAEIVQKVLTDIYELEFGYASTNLVMRLLADENVQQLSHDFDIECKIIFGIRKSESARVFNKFNAIKKLRIKHLSSP